jgi:type II secretory pathway component PulC
MNKNSIKVIMIFVIAVLWLLSCYMIIDMFTNKHYETVHVTTEKNMIEKSAAIADSALKMRLSCNIPVYKGEFSDPFKTSEDAFRATVMRKNTVNMPKLKLKGVLLKNQPYAIMEDETGHTYICGINESVMGQTVEKIMQDTVVLKNSNGTFMLTQ